MATDKMDNSYDGYLRYFLLPLHRNICCGYSLELPHRVSSSEYP